jgi:hypothetical protein
MRERDGAPAEMTRKEGATVDLDESEDPNAKEAFKFFCRHLVAVRMTYALVDEKGKDVGKPQVVVYSGFVVEVRGAWLIATAGHNLHNLEECLLKIRVIGCQILDNFGPGQVSNFPIPFNLADAPRFYMFQDDSKPRLGLEEGLDFGLIWLNSNNVQLLKANNVVPVSDDNMRHAANASEKWHAIVGFPECFQSTTFLPNGRITHDFSPVIASVEELDPPPDDLTETQYPRFVGKLADAANVDIAGMSGGPIIGFSSDRRRYWVVAIQSKWIASRRITFGCPTPVFLELVEDSLEQYEAEHTVSAT